MQYVRFNDGKTLHVLREGVTMLCGKSAPFYSVIPESTVKALGGMEKVCKRCEQLRKKVKA